MCVGRGEGEAWSSLDALKKCPQQSPQSSELEIGVVCVWGGGGTHVEAWSSPDALKKCPQQSPQSSE